MPSANKIQLISTFIMVLVLVLVFVTIFSSNNVFAQTLHNRTLYEIVKQDSQLYENPQIDAGIEPKDVEIHERTNKVYVANRGSDTISVISGDSNTKIKDIPVGNRPIAIGINNFGDKVYVANFNSANISVISTATDTRIKDIPVGNNPSDIAIDEYKNRIYVVNQGSDSISVIENDTNINKDILVENNPYAIGVVRDNSFTTNLYITNPDSDSITVINAENYSKVKEIPVGERPMAITTDEFANRDLIFVANAFSDNITIIDGNTNTKIENISVGKMPMDINIVRPNLFTAKIFVANSASNNISVIDENGMTEYIPVGNSPSAIGINERTNSVYVSNLFSNGVSVIDGVNNTLLARILVNVNPFNAGFIECDGLKTPTNQYVYVWSRAECIAKQNKGFEFQSWEENLNNNSTLIIKGSFDTSNTIFDFIANSLDSIVNFFGLKSSLDSIVNFFGLKSSLDSIGDFFNIQSENPEAKLKITKFGTFTANFKELPPPLPPEYWGTLFGVLVSSVIGGWLIPNAINFFSRKKQINKLDYFHTRIGSLFRDKRIDESDIPELNGLNKDITKAYTKGKLNQEYYTKVKNEISVLYKEIFSKQLSSKFLFNKTSNTFKKIEDELNNKLKNISNTYTENKLNNEHYNNLKDEISILYEELLRNQIYSIDTLNREDKIRAIKEIKNKINDVYSKGTLNDKHFNLLKEKILEFENNKESD